MTSFDLEIESIYDNQVWNLFDLPEGARPIECKWINKIKTDMDGKSLFVCKKVSGSFFFLVLYLDDILIVGNSVPMLEFVKAWVSSCFSIN
jgi:hypothetical protein